MATKTLTCRIFLNEQLVDTRSFQGDVIKLGRLASSHIQLDDQAVGRMHAVIELGQDGSARVVDLGSAQGTRLNGVTIERSHALRNGDRLELGPYRLELAIAELALAPAVEPAVAQAPVAAPAIADRRDPAMSVDLSQVEDASEQVAEVVATYGRSILDVAHVGQARDRKRSAMPLIALGGVLMAGGLGLFGYEVSQPWDEYAVELAEAQAHHREAPPAPGLGTGSLGMMLALLGLVPFLAGTMRLREESLEAYTIGESPEASFRVSGESLSDPGASPLVRRVAGGYALAFAPSMRGSVELGGERVPLEDLVASGRATRHEGTYLYPLPAGTKARVEHGDVSFNVSLVNRGAIVASRGEVDWPFWGYFGGTATIATAFYLLMRSMPDDALSLQLEKDEAAERFARYFHQADNEHQDEPVETETEPVAEEDKAQSGETGKRAGGREGKMGDPSQRSTGGAYSMAGPKEATPRLARTFDPVASARNAGILGILATQDKHFLASIDGGAYAVGNEDEDVWGGLVGTEVATGYGVGGLGLTGSSRGGGGADGLIGLGTTGLLGHGTGTGGLYHGKEGGKGTGIGPRKARKPTPYVGKGEVKGVIDKDMIRRIVRAHINEIRSCYNAGLTRNPNLEGRVKIQFSIVGTGRVGAALVQENSTRDSQVGNCIAKAVKRWKFPRPGGGGTAMVSYPFRLSFR